MPEEYVDPSGNTQAFRAFVQSPEPAAAPSPSKLPLILGVVLAVVVVTALVVWFALA